MTSYLNLLQDLQEELICPICREYFKNPLSIECGHSFCQSCLLRCRQEASDLFACPNCRSVSQLRDFQVNVSLGKLVAVVQKLSSYCLQKCEGHAKCEIHHKVQKLFCGVDHSPICVSCSQSKDHEAHSIYCIDEAAEDFREKLQETMNDLWRKTEKVVQKMANERVLLKGVEEEIETQKKNILSEFRKAQQFLDEEKNECLSIVKTWGRINLDGLKKRIRDLSNQSQDLRKRITELQEECKKPNVDLLQNITGILKRNKFVLHKKMENFHLDKIVCPIPGIIEMLSTFKVDITLDCNTANPNLIISEDLKSVRYGGIEEKEFNNSGGFRDMVLILGSQSFISKRCYWEVRVPGNTCSCVGVCKISPQLESFFALLTVPKNNCCYLYAVASDYLNQKIQLKYLQISESSLKLGIFLDHDRGEISFYHVRERYLIYTFPTTSFSGPFRPLFSLSKKVLMNDSSLTICPLIENY